MVGNDKRRKRLIFGQSITALMSCQPKAIKCFLPYK
ncbi:Uncharacterised protein [Vibrio cholerae]|nr:Uncharacterised protein [Vibrio cholerae]